MKGNIMREKITPYDTGKVKIGCAYTPPPPSYPVSADMERLQRGLLQCPRTVRSEYGSYIAVAVLCFLASLMWVIR